MLGSKPKMSLKKKIGIVLLALLAIPVTYSVAVIVKQKAATHAAKHKVAIARSAVEERTDSKVADFEAALISSGIAGTRIASSKVSVCYVDHDDEGWFAANWYQGCYLRYVRGYTTQLSKSSIENRVRTNNAISGLVGTVFSGDSDRCQISFGIGDFNLNYLPSGFLQTKDSSCKIPNQLQGLFSVDPFEMDDELTVKDYAKFDTTQIGDSQNQIWFDFDQNYYRENLGCGVSLLCDSPRTRAVQE